MAVDALAETMIFKELEGVSRSLGLLDEERGREVRHPLAQDVGAGSVPRLQHVPPPLVRAFVRRDEEGVPRDREPSRSRTVTVPSPLGTSVRR